MPSDATEAALGLLGLTAAFTNSASAPPPSSASSSTVPAKRKQAPSSSASNDNSSANSDTITCICGYSYDDGFSIACDSCGRWCHAACFQIDEQQVPDEWLCWRCDPRPVDKERAVKIQRARQRAAAATANANKRKGSPGVERRSRKPSGVAADPAHAHTTKRKRRASITAAAHAHHQNQGEDEHVDIDEPWQQTYVAITKDIVKSDDARDRLRRVASEWRGVTAISPSPSLTPGCSTPALLTPDALPSHPPISLQPLPNNASYPSLFAPGNPSVRPPSYAIHATQPIPSSKYIASYPSTIISTAAYLSDPLNAYAHLGMPKPYVHLIGPPLDVALDARFTGDQSRFVRSGCRPNAVIRPVLCNSKKAPSSEEEMLSFGIFALRDLKPNEEVVLGWEWDDENVVHHLPALIESPFAFPPHQIQHFRKQMTSMLHALSSTFTTCACGAKARDCALARMAEFVENQTPLTPSPSPPSQFTKEKNAARGKNADESASAAPVDLGPLVGLERGFRTRERIPSSGGMGGVEMVPPTPEAEAGPSRVHAEPQSAGGRRVSFPDDLLSPPVKARRAKGRDRKGKARAEDEDVTEESDGGASKARSRIRRRASPEPDQDAMDVDSEVSPPEEQLPPRMRKTWIRESAVRLEERKRRLSQSKDKPDEQADGEDHKTGDAEQSFDSREMPPPPVPPARTPPLSSVTTNHPRSHPRATSPSSATSASKSARTPSDAQASPSTSFSKLSLLSPVVPSVTNVSSPSSHPHSLPSAQSESASPSQAAASLPPPAPAPRKRKPTVSSQPPAEGKEAKKPKARSRKDKTKDSAREKDKDSDAGPGTPSTPVQELQEDSASLQPSIVRKKEIALAAKRKKSIASAARSPRVDVKEKEVEPKVTPSASATSSGVSSPATTTAALPPSTPVVERPEPLASLPEPPREADVVADVSPRPAVESLEVKREDAREDATMSDAPAPAPASLSEVVVEDVPMADERPVSSPLVPSSQAVLAAESEPRASTVQTSTSPAISAPVPPSPAPPPAPELHASTDGPPPSPVNAVAEESSAPPLADVERGPDAPPQDDSRNPAEPAPTSVLPEPEHAPERPKTPSPPPPPPKVKLSLRDFAMRKKKQREEQQEKDKLATPSPLVPQPELPPDTHADAVDGAKEEPRAAEERQKDEPRVTEAQDGEGLALKVDGDDDVRMADDKPLEEPPAREGPAVADTPNIASPVAEVPHEEPSPLTSVPAEPTSSLPAPSAEPTASITESPPAEPVVDSSKLDKPEDTGNRPRSPSPAPPKLAVQPVAVNDSPSPNCRTPMDDSFRAKVELLDDHGFNGRGRASDERRYSSSYTPSPRGPSPTSPARDRFDEPFARRESVSSYRRESRTPPPLPTSPKIRALAPQPSQEDGEIFSPPPPKPPPLAPRSHTPPTQPRSFYASGGSPPSRRSSPPPLRRPLHPTSYRNAGTARPLPSAPRALRTPGGYSHPYGGQNAPYYAPRGPSADRDRDRDRDERDRDRDRDRGRERPSRDWGRERGDGDRSWIPGPSRGRGRGWGR